MPCAQLKRDVPPDGKLTRAGRTSMDCNVGKRSGAGASGVAGGAGRWRRDDATTKAPSPIPRNSFAGGREVHGHPHGPRCRRLRHISHTDGCAYPEGP